MLGVVLNEIIKMAVHDPRPYWLDPHVQLLAGAETSFGIPSGHAQNSLLLWGLIAAYIKKPWGWAMAMLITLLIGFSRIYLGVHFPTDVLAGWLIGAIMLALIIRLEKPVLDWFSAKEKPVQVAIVAAISAGIFLIGVMVQVWVSGTFVVPDIWIQNAAAAAPYELIEPFSLKNIILGSVVFGASAVTAILYAPQAKFDAGGFWSKRVGRYIVGMLGVIILWGASEMLTLLLPGKSAVGVFFQIEAFILIGAWVLALGPLLFVRVGLAKKPELSI